MVEKVEIGNATLYLGDCREIVPTLEPSDILASDPPYGIAFRYGAAGARPGRRGSGRQGQSSSRPIEGDQERFDPTPWLRFPEVILWGANHFHHGLPEAGRWLAWNKLGGKEPWDDFADVEFAGCSNKGADKIFSHLWKGMCQAGAGERRYHPTQKPVELMAWCLGFATGRTVLDPYMGSGTTGVACVRLGRPFVGIEIDPAYFEVACRRVADAGHDLLLAPPTPTTAPQQLGLLGEP